MTTPPRGLTSEEAGRRLLESGPNAVIEQKSHLTFLALLEKFWAPVPWMLEATIVLELALGKFVEGIVISRCCWCPMPRWVFSRKPARAKPWSCCRSGLLCARGFCVTTYGA